MSKVNLVGLTKPSGITGCSTAEELVAYAARVSNPENQDHHESSPRLLRYLIKHGHWSPFEMVSITMEITTTRDIARQMLRHRSFSFQEFSQRYAVQTGFETRDARLQDPKNRQNSIEVDDESLQLQWALRQDAIIKAATNAYEWAIENGIAKEQARAVLPEGNTVSRMYMQGSLRSWIHYIDLRSGNGTQKEHIEIAKACGEVISKIFPMTEEIT